MAVDRIVERDGREAPCRTHEIPLGLPLDPAELPELATVDEESRAHLAARYGHAAQFVLRLVEAAPALGERISPELPDIVAEAPFAAGPRAGALARRRAAAPHPARACSTHAR